MFVTGVYVIGVCTCSCPCEYIFVGYSRYIALPNLVEEGKMVVNIEYFPRLKWKIGYEFRYYDECVINRSTAANLYGSN